MCLAWKGGCTEQDLLEVGIIGGHSTVRRSLPIQCNIERSIVGTHGTEHVNSVCEERNRSSCALQVTSCGEHYPSISGDVRLALRLVV